MQPVPEIDEHQPTTPLKLCVFRLSDYMLEESNKKQLVDIASLLVQYGADKKEALEYFKLRYGTVGIGQWSDNYFVQLYQLLDS